MAFRAGEEEFIVRQEQNGIEALSLQKQCIL